MTETRSPASCSFASIQFNYELRKSVQKSQLLTPSHVSEPRMAGGEAGGLLAALRTKMAASRGEMEGWRARAEAAARALQEAEAARQAVQVTTPTLG